MNRLISFLSLFTSLSTLVCCALPALFVVLGFGAAFAGLVSFFPEIVWISENKIWFFSIGLGLLVFGGLLQWRSRKQACPVDSSLGAACATTKDWSLWIYLISVALYGTGAFFSFLAPLLL